jgi:hypothetical protein
MKTLPEIVEIAKHIRSKGVDVRTEWGRAVVEGYAIDHFSLSERELPQVYDAVVSFMEHSEGVQLDEPTTEVVTLKETRLPEIAEVVEYVREHGADINSPWGRSLVEAVGMVRFKMSERELPQLYQYVKDAMKGE